MQLPLRSFGTILVVVLAGSTATGCRCEGSVSGSVNDAGFSFGTPPSSAPAPGPSAAPTTTTLSRSFKREHDSGRCPPPEARTLTGGKLPGSECTSADECAASCCKCAESDVGWLAAACIDGRCGDRSASCAEPPNPGFCHHPHKKSTTTRYVNDRCAPKTGGKAPGEICEEGVECAMTCCPCAGKRSWSAAACVNGRCAARTVTCAVAPMPDDYCDDAPKSSSRSVRGEQQNGGCPSPSSELAGSTKAGQKCETAADCAPACCECGNGKRWLGAACIDHRCAPQEITCVETESTGSYCGTGCRGAGAPCWRGGECCSASCGDDHRCA